MIGEQISKVVTEPELVIETPAGYFRNEIEYVLNRKLDRASVIYVRAWVRFADKPKVTGVEVWHDHFRQKITVEVKVEGSPVSFIVGIGEFEASAPDHFDALVRERLDQLEAHIDNYS